jgi:Trypsin-like peptidase domain
MLRPVFTILATRFCLAASFCLLGALESKAAPLFAGNSGIFPPPPLIPVVVFGERGRLTAVEFARQNGIDADYVARRHTASGIIHCGNARGAGQLTLANNIVTTAAHVLFNENGALRGDKAHCTFTAIIAGEINVTSIDVASIVTGGADPYGASPAHDWAVARLMRPIEGARAYAIGAAPRAGTRIEFAARGHADWGEASDLSLQDCALREVLAQGSEGTREVSFDCDAGIGASGGALLDATGARLDAIFVGYRSQSPDRAAPFSPRHYNLAVTLEGAFARAVETMAGVRATAER